jgi:hydrogenase maturation protease
MPVSRAPVLILAWGNPSRGDDALGPRLIERLERLQPFQEAPLVGAPLDLLTDFQLQIEHALDLVDRDLVVFADAAVSGSEPFGFGPVTPEPALSVSTHALSPGALLGVFRRVLGHKEPACYVLGIRGYTFDLGSEPSPKALINLDAALAFLEDWLPRALQDARGGEGPPG